MGGGSSWRVTPAPHVHAPCPSLGWTCTESSRLLYTTVVLQFLGADPRQSWVHPASIITWFCGREKNPQFAPRGDSGQGAPRAPGRLHLPSK